MEDFQPLFGGLPLVPGVCCFKSIGTPIRVYTNTVNMDGGRFACVYVEIDLSVPVVGKFFLNGAWYHVEYE
ncbi:hypothetical protein JHK86_050122 [Glycine max]|nr:hypothetical protein JHK86_050122 [Glycine max]